MLITLIAVFNLLVKITLTNNPQTRRTVVKLFTKSMMLHCNAIFSTLFM